MKPRPLFISLLLVAIASLTATPSATAATIFWSGANVTAPLDVSTNGTLIGAMNMGSTVAETINGVNFAADPGNIGSDMTLSSGTAVQVSFGGGVFDNNFWASAAPGGDANYDNALDYGRNSDSVASGTVTLSGLVPGNYYEVQLWIPDTRSCCSNRTRTVDGALLLNSGSGPNIARGVFGADSSSQVITISGVVGMYGPQLNLLQLRSLVHIVVQNPNDAGPGSLRQAISNAPPGGIITFTNTLSGQTILLTNGLMVLSNNVMIDASSLQGGIQINGNKASRIFRVNGGVTAVLNSLTLTNGNDINDLYNGGGAIYNGGTLTVNNCVLTGNQSNSGGPGGGGGIFNQGTLMVNNSAIAANQSSFSPGGGILNYSGSATVSNCTFTGNLANSQGGGGILNQGTLTVYNSTFTTNQANSGSGGGIQNYGGSATVSNCLFTGNLANNGQGGGGILNQGTLTVNNSTFATNQASSSPGGGGIQNYSGSATVSNCIFTGNLANNDQGGGGIFNRSTLSAFNSTFTGNQANGSGSSGGGGVYNNQGSLTLFNCTIVGNQANGTSFGGGGISSQATLTVNNCTIVLNQANNSQGGAGIYSQFASLNLTNSIVCSNTAASGTNIFGTVTPAASTNNLLDTNPILAPLGNYGGPTPTMRPLAGSPAIDAGTDSVTNVLATDQRGYPRKAGAHVDIGAVELYPNEAYIVLNNSDNGPGSLRQTALNASSGSTITFATNLSGQTIQLTSGQIVLSSNVTFDASTLTNGIQIDGNNASRIFSISSGATVALQGLSLTGGNAGGNNSGGAIINNGVLQILGCALVNNHATNGSGGAIDNENSCTMQNCTLAGNFASGVGGALYNNGPFKLIHCTLSLNIADVGGGGFANNNLATLDMTNCIVAGNTGTAQPDIYNFNLSTIAAGGTNIVLGWVNNGTFTGTNSIVVKDPLLSSLGNYGGPTQTMPPKPGSPAIHSAGATSLAYDQRGFPRPLDVPDIGAVELQTPFAVVTSNGDNSSPGTLRNVIANADWSSTVSFADSLSGQSILLTNGQIALTKVIVIDGSALTNGIQINANHASRIFTVNGGVNVVLTGLTLTNGNEVIGGAARNDGILLVNQCTFAGNMANCGCGIAGGAIINNSLLTVSNSTFTGNTGSFGGALFNNTLSTMTVIQCTFTGNQGTNGGGAIYNFGTSLTVSQSTVVGNFSTGGGSQGGGIGNGGGTFYLTNTIVCSNTAASSPNIAGTVIPLSSINNLVDVNAMLYPLANYGGPTQTMPPLPGSPALNAGAATSLATDQRGFPRPVGAPDIGAVELQSLTAVVTTNSDDSTPGTLRNVIANAEVGGAVTFAAGLSGQSILLTNGQIVLTRGIMIDGSALANGLQINGNHASRIFTVNGGVNMVITGLTLTNGNQQVGGAVRNDGILLVNQCTFAGNTANCGCGIAGGAIINNSILTVSNSTFTGNTGSFGGALFNNTLSTMTVIQCTFTVNQGTNGGGAIYNFGTSLTVNQSTVVGNSSTGGGSQGGGIGNGGGGFYLTNTIVCSNTASSFPNIAGNVIPFSSPNNLVDTNALLGPLGNYGGPTQTMPPLAGSPAIDAGSDSITNFLSTDQRLLQRLFGAHLDIGAVELQGIIATNPSVLTGPKRLGNGAFQFSFTNLSGASFTAFASTNLALPVAQWSNLGAVFDTPAGSGQFQFTDTQATNYPRRFYRVASP